MDPLLRHRAARDRERTSDSECPDAEVLAAFVDGELPAKERRAVEAHAADCQRCADTLALSAAAEDPALSATISHVVAVDRWRRAYWTVPLATAATLAALWIATSREAVAPTQPRLMAGTPGAPSAAQGQPITAESPPLVPDAAGNASSPAREERQSDTVSPPLRDQRGAARTPSAGAQEVQPRAKASGAFAPQATGSATPAPAQQRASADTLARAPAAARPTALAETIGVASIRMVSPDMRNLWRTTGTTVERSSDGGTTWTQEFSAPGVLTAGAAVSADTAWLGGVQGLVLRRSASGWAQVTAPADETVTAIRATSADEATVTLASGRMLQTTDAGQTWR